MAFLEPVYILWETTKETTTLTDKKSFTRFLQTKAKPPKLWNALFYLLRYKFKTAHIAGSVNTAAYLLFGVDLEVTEKVLLKKHEDSQTTPTDVTTSSKGATSEELFFFTQADNETNSDGQTNGKKEQSQQTANQRVAKREPASFGN